MKAKTIVLCVSEMSPVLAESFVSQGKMPHLAQIMATGATGRTRYEAPYYLTPQMWATITTGVSAAEHGIFDYYQRDKNGVFQETIGGQVSGSRFWDQLAANKLRPGVVNVPLTYPPKLSRGFMISGQDAPGEHSSIAIPNSFYLDLQKKFGRYRLKDVFPGGQNKSDYVHLLQREIDHQIKVFETIASRDDWDFLMLYTSGVAMAQHYFWAHHAEGDANDPFRNVVMNAFQSVDRMIGALSMAVGEPGNICVVSECGAGPIAQGVNLNVCLRNNGFLRFKSGTTPRNTGRRIERDFLRKIRASTQRYLPKKLFYWANKSLFKKWLQNRIATGGFDWSGTRAYHRGKGEGNIYFNMIGRDPNGIVRPEDREQLAKEIEASLLNLADEHGNHPVVAVHRREDLFSGPHLEAAPDMIVEWRDAAYMPTEQADESGAVFGPRWREYMSWPTTGSHRPCGFFSAAGPSIAGPIKLENIGLLDLAPTWLALCDVSCPKHWMGRVPIGLLRDSRPTAKDTTIRAI